MVETHERVEKAHEAAHGHEGHEGSNNKRIAVVITLLAALLAITETAAKNAQNLYMTKHVEVANLWAFYQAKTIRYTTLRVAAEQFDAVGYENWGANKDKVAAQVKRWRETGDRYESEPSTGEGRKELMARAQAAEEERGRAHAKLHMFEYGSASFQLAIVLASAAVITGVALLAFAGLGLGAIGIAFGALGWFAPTLLHI
jgi:hypothetical protein